MSKDETKTEYGILIDLDASGAERINIKRGEIGKCEAPIPEDISNKDSEAYAHTHPKRKGQDWGKTPSPADIQFASHYWKKDKNKKQFIIPATSDKAIQIKIKDLDKFRSESSKPDYNQKISKIGYELTRKNLSPKEYRKQLKKRVRERLGIDFKYVDLTKTDIPIVEPVKSRIKSKFPKPHEVREKSKKEKICLTKQDIEANPVNSYIESMRKLSEQDIEKMYGFEPQKDLRKPRKRKPQMVQKKVKERKIKEKKTRKIKAKEKKPKKPKIKKEKPQMVQKEIRKVRKNKKMKKGGKKHVKTSKKNK